jgi:hypothetical protein
MFFSPTLLSLQNFLHPVTWLLAEFSLPWPLIKNHPGLHPPCAGPCFLLPGFLLGLYLLEKDSFLTPDIFS